MFLKVIDFESSLQNPYDRDTLQSELPDIITAKVASDDICQSLKNFLDLANTKRKKQKFLSRHINSF